MPNHRRLVTAAGAVAAAAVLAACGGDGTSASARQQAVAERGAEVMPFDLEATTHRFETRSDGVVQTVVADDRSDRQQIELVRGHLRAEAAAFREGDFDDPSAIHGETMPGLSELRGHDGRITIDYLVVDGGAQLVFSTGDAGLVDALHRWADAQVKDHGSHAEHG